MEESNGVASITAYLCRSDLGGKPKLLRKDLVDLMKSDMNELDDYEGDGSSGIGVKALNQFIRNITHATLNENLETVLGRDEF